MTERWLHVVKLRTQQRCLLPGTGWKIFTALGIAVLDATICRTLVAIGVHSPVLAPQGRDCDLAA